MANWNSNDGVKNQRKRSFIYKSAGQNKPVGKAVKVDPDLTSTSISSRVHSSPRKKIDSSYSFYDKTRSDQEAAEELCSDLPADAFEDDLGDDFGDDLSAEQLCEAALIAEKLEKEMAAKKKNFKEITTTDQHLGENDFGDLAVVNDVLEEGATRKQLNNNACHATATITSETNHDETNFDISAHETTALLFSSPSCSTNTLRNNDGIMLRNSKGGRTLVSNGCTNGNTGSEELQVSKSKLRELKEKVRKLEEDKFLMDGQLKTMNDTLAHYQATDAKQREKIRMIEEEKRKTVDEKEKELKKQIEQLTTQLYFKDQEIAQVKQKKQMQVANECSPHRKKNSKLADNSFIPTGQSFFEKKPVDVQLSPKNKAVKLQKSPVKGKPTVVRSVLEGPSSAGKVSSDSREFEKRSVKKDKKLWDGNENELLQKLLKLENIRVKSLSPEFEVCGVNQSILLLLNSSSRVGPMEQSRREEGAEGQKLVKQQTHTPKKGIELELNMESKDSGLQQSVYDNIQDLLNVQPTNFNDKCKEQLNLVSNCIATNIFDSHQKASSVQGFLPLLEYHISQYIDLCLENDEESLSSTCSPGSPGEGVEMRQPVDKEGSLSLLEALDAAVQSLRCLNILVLHNLDVCELLLRSSKIFSCNENEVEELTVANNGIQQQSSNSHEEKSDLLNLVFKLAVPLQNEPLLVTQVALCVISSLAQRCPTVYRNRFLPMLCDTLLPQCISRDSSPTVISLLVPILIATASIPHLMKHLCSQSDECLLLKVYQSCLSDADDSSHQIMFEVIALIETILSSKTEAIPLLFDSECHCSLEVFPLLEIWDFPYNVSLAKHKALKRGFKLLKSLVLLLHKKMVFLQHFPADTLKLDKDIRDSFLLLRRGCYLLAYLLTNSSRLLADLRVEVEQQYVNLIIGTTQLYGAIKDMPDGEGMLLQDLLDFEHIEDDEVQQDYDEDGVEEMEVDT